MNRISASAALALVFCSFSDARAVEPRVAGYGSNIFIVGQPFPQYYGIGSDPQGMRVSINNSGRTAFMALAHFADEDQDDVILSEASGVLAELARAGGAAAGLPAGVLYDQFAEEVHLNNAGQASFAGRLRLGAGGVTADNDSAFWTQAPGGAVQLVAREGDQPAGLPAGARFGELMSPYVSRLTFDHALNHAGRAAFVAPLQTGFGGVTADNDSGIWSQTGGSLALVARKGDHAPGTPADVVFDEWGTFPLLNDAGHLAFVATLRGVETPISTNNNFGIWAQRTGGLELIARKGDPAAGVPAGVTYRGVFGPRFDAQSHIFFGGSLTGPGITSDNESALWSDRSGALEPVIRAATPAPGLAAGAVFRDFGGFSTNAVGALAFSASLKTGVAGIDPTNNYGVWVERNGGLQLIARSGSPAPGLPSDYTFLTLNSPEINAAGRIAFSGQVFSWGADKNTPRTLEGIWAEDSGGQLRLIALQDSIMDFGPAGGRSHVQELRLATTGGGSVNGLLSAFNDSGQVGFYVGTGFYGLETGYSTDAVLVANANDGILLAGDFDNDGVVDGGDLAPWRSAFGQPSRGGDANRDFFTDGHDFLIWQRELGRTAPGNPIASAIPEPTAGSLAAFAALALAGLGLRRGGV